ncbi:MAG: recombinase family protein [Defluviitaleaceae bacterium]|nr:recombinase family protein [Defluviitaleaceae bacterium]
MKEMYGNQEKYAYVRVSSDGQNEARQLKEIYKQGVPKRNIIIEKATGKNFNRGKYHELAKRLKSGDTLYIGSIDRLGRDYDGIISEWSNLTKEKRIIVKVLNMPLLNTDRQSTALIDKFVSDIVLLTLAYQAEQEWHNIKAHQRAGIAIAKENGKHMGRPKASYSEYEIRVVKDWKCGMLSLDEAMKKLGRKKSSFYKLVHELEK